MLENLIHRACKRGIMRIALAFCAGLALGSILMLAVLGRYSLSRDGAFRLDRWSGRVALFQGGNGMFTEPEVTKWDWADSHVRH
jgi:hypothetical protein